MPIALQRWVGPFGFQPNSPTRAFEYPWCFGQCGDPSGKRIVDVGSGLGGMQFLLASSGAEVVSVDPMVNPNEQTEWTVPDSAFSSLNKAFGTNVRFVRRYLEHAGLEASSYDMVLLISVLEHVPDDSLQPLLTEVRRVLRPGGRMIATVDLFLDSRPFTPSQTSKYGRNVSIQSVAEMAGLSLVCGKRDELFGFPEFSAEVIMRNRARYFAANDVMSQCFVLGK